MLTSREPRGQSGTNDRQSCRHRGRSAKEDAGPSMIVGSSMEVAVNLAKIWSSTLGTMQVQTSRHEFNTWLRRASLLGIENGTATIGAPSAFFKEGLENRYIGPLRELISNLAGFPVQVRVVIAPPQNGRAEPAPTNDYEQDDDHHANPE